MDNQALFNLVLGVAMLLAGFLLNALWVAVKDLQASDKALVDRVSQIDVLVAGNYVRRDDLERVAAEIFRKLERIENSLYHKVDKQ